MSGPGLSSSIALLRELHLEWVYSAVARYAPCTEAQLIDLLLKAEGEFAGQLRRTDRQLVGIVDSCVAELRARDRVEVIDGMISPNPSPPDRRRRQSPGVLERPESESGAESAKVPQEASTDSYNRKASPPRFPSVTEPASDLAEPRLAPSQPDRASPAGDRLGPAQRMERAVGGPVTLKGDVVNQEKPATTADLAIAQTSTPQEGGDAASYPAEVWLAHDIPLLMRVHSPEAVEIRLPRTVSLTGLPLIGSGRRELRRVVTTALSLRLTAPRGGFAIDALSPETKWMFADGSVDDEFVSWRFTITPVRRGFSPLCVALSYRQFGESGLTAERSLPDKTIDVRVKLNILRLSLGAIGWTAMLVAAAVLGAYLNDVVGWLPKATLMVDAAVMYFKDLLGWLSITSSAGFAPSQ